MLPQPLHDRLIDEAGNLADELPKGDDQLLGAELLPARRLAQAGQGERRLLQAPGPATDVDDQIELLRIVGLRPIEEPVPDVAAEFGVGRGLRERLDGQDPPRAGESRREGVGHLPVVPTHRQA
ncbi:hypothetical protein ACWGI8_01545 [Streptomyces sp. NPDC054841]